MNDELIQSVARTAQLTPGQARAAVAAVLRFLAARLPSALVGELHARLEATSAAGANAREPLPRSEDERQ